ncbi:helix-turn-helix protein [Cupriavidus alkaliphilus]|uniref:helix-turn-helix domain-containing protein n=1 Tax=Cupriavidus alkaliphilus TaxID=942866 RepID=UPI000DE68C24|nr:helix-turn-helix domain-containing protein [Cupriavidus alkaliphilus]PVY81076.1 helix-turn-helix protein [Cupriavidus alkaliphilus]
MSTIIMSQCWPLEGMSIAQKAVLISLADNANDQGVCWPSIPTISKRVCASERAVQNAIKWLEAAQVVTANRSNGRHTSYTVTPAAYSPPQEIHPRTTCTGAGDSPAQEMHHTPAADAGVPPQEVRQPPHQVPSNRKEPPKEPSGNRQGAPAKSGKAAKQSALFERLWQAYPRKVAKADAEKAFAKLGADEALVEQLLAAIAKQSAWPEWREEGGKFIPHPATWLNGKRWLDEPAPQQPAGPGGVPAGGGDATWWESAPGIEAKGAEVWRARKAGEEFQRYKVGVFKAAGDGPWRQALLADLLRTKSSVYADVHAFFYGHPPTEGQV